MTLVDTSVWVDHFRKPDPLLVDRLHEGLVLCHPFVVGELALGNLRARDEVTELLRALPALPVSPDDDVLEWTVRVQLGGTGLGWVDAHLLAAADRAGVRVLTSDKRLRRQAARLDLLAE